MPTPPVILKVHVVHEKQTFNFPPDALLALLFPWKTRDVFYKVYDVLGDTDVLISLRTEPRQAHTCRTTAQTYGADANGDVTLLFAC